MVRTAVEWYRLEPPARHRESMRGLERLEAFTHGRELAVTIYALTDLPPLERNWSLVDQMRRAAVSTPSNIAEAFALSTRPQLVRGLRIALGSAIELQTQLWIARRSGRLPELEISEQAERFADRETGLLAGLLKSYGVRIQLR